MSRLVYTVLITLLARSLTVAALIQATTYSDVQLVRVVDGDTVRLDLHVAPDLWYKNVSCRLLRIDAPEMRTAGGAEARRGLIQFLQGKKLAATVKGKDRFGRFLIELFVQEPPVASPSAPLRAGAPGSDAINVSDWLVRSGFAVPR